MLTMRRKGRIRIGGEVGWKTRGEGDTFGRWSTGWLARCEATRLTALLEIALNGGQRDLKHRDDRGARYAPIDRFHNPLA